MYLPKWSLHERCKATTHGNQLKVWSELCKHEISRTVICCTGALPTYMIVYEALLYREEVLHREISWKCGVSYVSKKPQEQSSTEHGNQLKGWELCKQETSCSATFFHTYSLSGLISQNVLTKCIHRLTWVEMCSSSVPSLHSPMLQLKFQVQHWHFN